jgi:putative ABC transport system permease protein
MFNNNLKVGWRNLKRQPFLTFLNTFGLAIGMAGGLLISLFIYDEFSFDKMFPDADRIHRINVDIKFGGQAQEFAVVPSPLAETVLDYSQVESTTRFRTQGSMLIKKTDAALNVKELQTTFVDSSFFEMFGLELLEGDPKTALKNPNSLILTKTAAEKHFKISEALGQSLLLNNSDTYIVTGVIDDLPKNSFLRNHSVFMAMSGYEDSRNMEWGSNNYNTFIKLTPSADIESFQAPLQVIFQKYLVPYAQKFMPGLTLESFRESGNYVNYSTMPLKDVHLYSNRVAEISPNNSIQNVYILSFIGFFLILLASVNFMNLSTAHSLKRAKEVGIRKTLGSTKFGLIKQFLTEAGLISFLSLLLALVVAFITMPSFNQLAGKDLSIPIFNPIFWLILISVAAVLGLFSGSYPAFFMSKFAPVKTLKGGGQSSVGGGGIRNMLVVFQFAISVFLIVSTLVVFQQLKYIQSKDLGFTKEQILIIDDVYGAGDQVKAFKQGVQQLALVKSATLSSYLPTPSSRSDNGYRIQGAPEQDNTLQMQSWRVDYDYISTLNFKIIEGRDFDQKYGTDTTGIIINESAIAVMGKSAKEALGMKVVRNFNTENEEVLTVIGVVKNFHYESLKDNIGAVSLTLGDRAGKMAIKLNAGDFANTITSIEKSWNEVAPGQPFNYYFMDDAFNETYQAEERLGSIFVVFTILSILIACLGLFGLAAFNAEKRTKEIGIRKVLGASVTQITYRLSVDFLKLVSISIFVALPLGWYAMNRWLENFSYRIEISWWIFVLAAFLAIIISVMTVSFQSIKAAIVNPIDSLKTE